MSDLDRTRAAGVGLFLASGTVTDDSPLIVDLAVPSDPTSHFILESLVFVGELATRRPGTQGAPPLSGLFLCPPATIGETLAQAQAGWVQAARPIPLPLADPYTDSAIIGGGPPYAIQFVLDPGYKRTVPNGWFLRAIVVAQAGTATPGPGANSNGVLRALMVRELNEC